MAKHMVKMTKVLLWQDTHVENCPSCGAALGVSMECFNHKFKKMPNISGTPCSGVKVMDDQEIEHWYAMGDGPYRLNRYEIFDHSFLVYRDIFIHQCPKCNETMPPPSVEWDFYPKEFRAVGAPYPGFRIKNWDGSGTWFAVGNGTGRVNRYKKFLEDVEVGED